MEEDGEVDWEGLKKRILGEIMSWERNMDGKGTKKERTGGGGKERM